MPKPSFPTHISPVLPIGLAIIATSMTFIVWLIGEQVLAALWGATQNRFNEQGLVVSTTLRYEWIAIPAAIAIGLWIWAAIVITRKQGTTHPGPFYLLRNFRRSNTGIMHVLVVGGVCLIIAGLFWMIFTYPVSILTDTIGLTFRDDAALTVSGIKVFVGAMPILVGIWLLAWGFTRTTQERETGISEL